MFELIMGFQGASTIARGSRGISHHCGVRSRVGTGIGIPQLTVPQVAIYKSQFTHR